MSISNNPYSPPETSASVDSGEPLVQRTPIGTAIALLNFFAHMFFIVIPTSAGGWFPLLVTAAVALGFQGPDLRPESTSEWALVSLCCLTNVFGWWVCSFENRLFRRCTRNHETLICKAMCASSLYPFLFTVLTDPPPGAQTSRGEYMFFGLSLTICSAGLCHLRFRAMLRAVAR